MKIPGLIVRVVGKWIRKCRGRRAVPGRVSPRVQGPINDDKDFTMQISGWRCLGDAAGGLAGDVEFGRKSPGARSISSRLTVIIKAKGRKESVVLIDGSGCISVEESFDRLAKWI